VHENPDPERLGEFREFVLAHGIRVGDLTHRAELQKLLASIAGTAEEHPLKIGLLKSLKRARYATAPLGHYGLAKPNYTHFTSPIRRYADLEVHRALASAILRADFASRASVCRLLPITFPRPERKRCRGGNRCGQNEETGILRVTTGGTRTRRSLTQ